MNICKCKNNGCLYHTMCVSGHDTSATLLYKFSESLEALGSHQSNEEIEKNYLNELQTSVNSCDAIKELSSRHVLYYNYQCEKGTVTICEGCKLKYFKNSNNYPKKSTYYGWKKRCKAIKLQKGKLQLFLLFLYIIIILGII